MKKLILTSLYVLLFGTLCSVSAAPLQPVNTSINTSINGTVNISGNFPPQNADYSQQGISHGFTSVDTSLAASVTTGGVPLCPHNGAVGSSAGVTFEQIALNEYVLTLTSTAMGQLSRTEAPGFGTGNLDGHSSLDVQSDFLIMALPFQQQGDVSTILLELEHFGTLSSVNNGLAHNQTHLSVFAPGPGDGFIYNSILNTPLLPMTEFEQAEFIGTRNITRNWSILSSVGQTINLSAGFDSDVFADLISEDDFNHISADSDFQSGIRLHMIVMPEPTTICLLGLGGLLLSRNRKSKKRK